MLGLSRFFSPHYYGGGGNGRREQSLTTVAFCTLSSPSLWIIEELSDLEVILPKAGLTSSGSHQNSYCIAAKELSHIPTRGRSSTALHRDTSVPTVLGRDSFSYGCP